MNLSFLVYLKNRTSGKFEYINNISNVAETDRGYRITFNNGKSYNYGSDNVMYYPLLSIKKGVRIYEKGILNRQFDTVNDYGSLMVFRNENSHSIPVHNNNDIEICEVNKNVKQSKSVLEYFRYILEQNGEISFEYPSSEEDSVNKNPNQISSKILLKAIAGIDILESRSALAKYLDEKNNSFPKIKKDSFIYPFGCNESQKLAVETSLTNSISIIEGPPGTGKTQTILNLIANLIVKGKSIAIVSNNNSAVFNIKEKLEKYGYAKLVASLGNNQNREEFFNSISELDNLPLNKMPGDKLADAKDELITLSSLLDISFQNQNRLAKLQTDLSDTKVEYRHLMEEQPLEANLKLKFDKLFYRKWDLQRAIRMQDLLPSFDYSNKISLKQKIILFFQYGLLNTKGITNSINEFATYINHKFYELYISKIEKEIDEVSKWLETNNGEENLSRFIMLSKEIFEDGLYKKYNNLRSYNFDKDNYKNNFESFINTYPVVLSSTLSLHTSIPKDYLFDYLIIDESSQVDVIKSSVCFSCSRNVVVVGDSMQLSHIVDDQSQKASEQFRMEYKVSPAYDYVQHNILTSLKTLYGDNIQSVLLREHYRCHPTIIGFCNKKYYNNNLVVMTNGEDYPFKIIETNISGERSNYNQRQIDETDHYIRQNFSDDYSKVGVIAPYRIHADMLQNHLPENSEADTIHKFQGREKDVIIFNTVKGKINPFIDNPNLINVAVSRAVKEFIIVKPVSMEPVHGTNIGDLIRYIQYTSNGNEAVRPGNISSVFDLLYKEYNKDFEIFMASNKDIDGSAAEVVMHRLLKDKILSENPQFSSIDMVREYKLRDLVRNIGQFTDDEAQFIRNNSRIDFLLYNKIDKSPILAIEVDGVSFHDNELQQKRDKKKNHILETISLPLLRLSTAGHNEEEKIVEALTEAMNI